MFPVFHCLSRLLPPANEVAGRFFFYSCLSVHNGEAVYVCVTETPMDRDPLSGQRTPPPPSTRTGTPFARTANPPARTETPHPPPPPPCQDRDPSPTSNRRGRYTSYWNASTHMCFISSHLFYFIGHYIFVF